MNENAVYLMVPKDIFKIGYSVKMSAESDDTAEVMLYGEIVGDVPSYWNYFYPEDKNASIFKKAIEDVKKEGATKLLLRINSPGGVCTEAVAMRSILANAGFDEINIRIEGLCASADCKYSRCTCCDCRRKRIHDSQSLVHGLWKCKRNGAYH